MLYIWSKTPRQHFCTSISKNFDFSFLNHAPIRQLKAHYFQKQRSSFIHHQVISLQPILFWTQPTFVKKFTTSQFLFLAKYFYCYTGATRTTDYQLCIYNPSNKLFVLPDSSFEVFKVLLRQIVSITLCKTRPWQGFQLQNMIMRDLM